MDRETLQIYIQLSDSQSREDFISGNDNPFLVQHIAQSGDDAPKPGGRSASKTTKIRLDDIQLMMLPEKEDIGKSRVIRIVGRDGDGNRITVGRTEENDIVLDSGEVSKTHARFSVDEVSGAFQVTDMGSTNGTSVNGDRLAPEEPHSLSDGDILSFASQEDYQFYLPSAFYDFVRSQKS